MDFFVEAKPAVFPHQLVGPPCISVLVCFRYVAPDLARSAVVSGTLLTGLLARQSIPTAFLRSFLTYSDGLKSLCVVPPLVRLVFFRLAARSAFSRLLAPQRLRHAVNAAAGLGDFAHVDPRPRSRAPSAASISVRLDVGRDDAVLAERHEVAAERHRILERHVDDFVASWSSASRRCRARCSARQTAVSFSAIGTTIRSIWT